MKAKKTEGFDYTSAVRATCEDIAFRLSDFAHVDMSKVAVSFCQTRVDSNYGIYASMTPLRFQRGERNTRKGGKDWTIQRIITPSGEEYLYLLYIYAPRFIDLGLSEKLETLVHELYHIGPLFDGDLRRFKGRCFAHGSSRKKYDATVRVFVRKWLDLNPPPEVWDYLRFNFTTMKERFGQIHGVRIAAPKIIPVVN